MEPRAINISQEQKEFLASYGVVYDYDNLTVDDGCNLEDDVADILLGYGMKEDFRIGDGIFYIENEIGDMAHTILALLA